MTQLAAILYERDFPIDALLLGVCDELKLRDLKMGGVLQSSWGVRGSRASSVFVVDLCSGESFDIWDNRGSGSRGCRLDERGLLSAEATIAKAIEEPVDLLVINRFGRAESQGRGLTTQITTAIEAGIPLLTAVRAPYVEAWIQFHGGLGCVLKPTPEAVLHWAGSVFAPPFCGAVTAL